MYYENKTGLCLSLDVNMKFIIVSFDSCSLRHVYHVIYGASSRFPFFTPAVIMMRQNEVTLLVHP
jgi:hypothetical protein